MRLFHFSDTHLGHQQYNRTDASGLNQREVDLANAFDAVVDAAVRERPDLVVHAGDLFDGVRPGNRPLAVALEGFLRLSRAGIPTVVIAGNHEHPRLRETGSPFRLFGHLSGLHVAYRGRRETFTFGLPEGPVRVHAVPQCPDNGSFAREVAEAPTGGPGLDLLVAHGAVPSLPAFAHAEFNGQSLDPGWFRPFHYVALGHYHGVQQVAPNAWYCGAPERVSLAEAGQEKGFLDVLVGPQGAQARLHPLPGRPYADLDPLDAKGLGAADVKARAAAAVAGCPDGAVVRLRIKGLDPALRSSLDLRSIRQAGSRFLHFEPRLEWSEAADQAAGPPALGGLAEEWEAFLATQPLNGSREDLARLAREVLV